MLLMSTSISGEAKRSFSRGIRLCPPASTFASPPTGAKQADRLVERPWGLVAEPGRIDVRLPSEVLSVSELVGRSGWRVRVGYRDRERLCFRVGPALLVWWPRALDRLAGDLQVLDQLRPRPHRGALARSSACARSPRTVADCPDCGRTIRLPYACPRTSARGRPTAHVPGLCSDRIHATTTSRLAPGPRARCSRRSDRHDGDATMVRCARRRGRYRQRSSLRLRRRPMGFPWPRSCTARGQHGPRH